MSKNSDMGYYSFTLAELIGNDAAVAYERLRFLIEDSKEEIGRVIEGRRWVFFNVTDLRTRYLKGFPNDKALRKTLAQLEALGLLETRSNGHGKWYCTNREALAKLFSQNGQTDFPQQAKTEASEGKQVAQNGQTDFPNRATAIYKEVESTFKTTSESTFESFSSPTAPSTAEEKEKIIPPPSNFQNEALVKALAQTCGITYPAVTAEIAAQLGEGVATIQRYDPDVRPSHFGFYAAYYEAVNHGRPLRPLPTLKYVTGKWGIFKAWLEPHLGGTETKTIPGTDIRESLTRREWMVLDDLPVGDTITLNHFRGDWDTVAVEFEKLPDGTFREVIELAQVV